MHNVLVLHLSFNISLINDFLLVELPGANVKIKREIYLVLTCPSDVHSSAQ